MEPDYRGVQGVRRWWEVFHEPWSEIKVIPERIAERTDGMDVLIRFEGIGRDGIETTMNFINSIEVRDGLLYRLVGKRADEETLRELGLD
jgi:hypothetical protein